MSEDPFTSTINTTWISILLGFITATNSEILMAFLFFFISIVNMLSLGLLLGYLKVLLVYLKMLSSNGLQLEICEEANQSKLSVQITYSSKL